MLPHINTGRDQSYTPTPSQTNSLYLSGDSPPKKLKTPPPIPDPKLDVTLPSETESLTRLCTSVMKNIQNIAREYTIINEDFNLKSDELQT
jgi:hypothetical protein